LKSFTDILKRYFQNGINWSCAGDSGSPLVKVEHPSSGGQPYFKLIGVLHGSKSLCDGRPLGEASMFANLEIFENFYFLQHILGVTKVLVTTGYESGAQNTEIIDVDDASFNCKVSQFPTSVRGATGGLVGDSPLICGGYYNDDTYGAHKSCYSLKEDGTWKLESDLNTARHHAANGEVIINNKLVIGGGNNGYYLDTIEVVAPNTRSETLPIRLPVAIRNSCIVPWDANTFMIIGGDSGSYRTQTYFIHMANYTYTNGPTLLTSRSHFVCHTMKINGEYFIIVAGGRGAWKSTEYLQKANYGSGWKKSVDLPVGIENHEIVASKDNKVLYTIGKYSNNKDIYKFTCTNSITNCSWTKIPTQLQYGRHYSVAMTIPNSLAAKLCN